MLEYNKQFLATYTLYQSLLKAVHDNDFQTFNQLIHTDDSNLSGYMQTSLKTLRKHQTFIQNTFNYPYSNGRIEGNHNKIKVLNRVAYGYRNLGNYIDRIVLNFNLRSTPKNHKNESQLAS